MSEDRESGRGAAASEGGKRETRDRLRPSGRTTHSSGALITGRLIGHGVANYQFRRDQDPSYYVKLQTMRGERVLWGKDLERAIKASTTNVAIDDMVGVRRVGRETVTITERQRNAQGHVVSQSEQLAHRNRWVVEKAGYFAERARLARRVRDEQLDARAAVRLHPELKSTFLTMRAAEEFAAQRIADARDRERFLELVKGAITGSIREGEPLPTVRMRGAADGVKSPTSKEKPDQQKNRVR